VFDIDGNERIDFLNNYTSYILGHGHPKVLSAIAEQAPQVIAVASPTPWEVDLAEEIKRRLPSLELLRFCNSGTEATMLAIRVARKFTKREKIVRMFGSYHGSHDYAAVSESITSSQSLNSGIPPGTHNSIVFVPFNDISSTQSILEPLSSDIAAIIIEPVMGTGVIPATREYLSFLRNFTLRSGSILIFDEVISFRIGYQGAQGYYGITPDLTSLGKIIGGGLAIGAVGGRTDIMNLFNPLVSGTIAHGGTFNANPLTMAAGLATLKELSPETFVRLEKDTLYFCEEVRKLFKKEGVPVQVLQIGSMFCIHLTEKEILRPKDIEINVDPRRRELFNIALANRGILLAPRGLGCLSTVMSRADLTEAVNRIHQTLSDLKDSPVWNNSTDSVKSKI